MAVIKLNQKLDVKTDRNARKERDYYGKESYI